MRGPLLRLAGRVLMAVLTGTVALTAAGADLAEFPVHQVVVVVPFPAGGPVDSLARLVAERLGGQWKQPVIVQNRPGAGGLVGSEYVARSRPDGYTLLVQGYGIGSYPLISKAAAQFDAEKELTPLSTVGVAPLVLMLNAQTPARTLRELADYSTRHPGQLNIAITANSQHHLDTVTVLEKLGINATLIPYNGTAPSTQALLANQVQLYLGTAYGKTAEFQSGRLVPLAVTSPEPFYMLPNVPTLKALGVNYTLLYWVGLLGPAGMDRPVATRVAESVGSVVKLAAVATQIRDLGYEPRSSTPDELVENIARDTAQARRTATAIGVQPQ